MSFSAIVVMTVGIVIIWGGLALSVKIAVSKK
ncbi:MAG: methionine/alanine import family NSS transporter small subunit [Bacilli bacterium]